MSSGKRSRASDPEQDPENGEEGSPDEDLGQGSKARRLRARRPTAKGSQSGSQKSVPLLQYLDGYDLSKYMNKFVEVRILPQSLTNSNHHVRGRHLWGTDVYTEDSDLVAVLQHTWYYVTTSTTPPPYISEVRAILKVVPGLKEGYSSSYRNGMRSRAWGRQEMKGDQGAAADTNSCAFEIEGCRVIKSSGQSVDLMPVENSALPIMPTFALAATEKLVITRASSQSGNRQQRCAQEVTLQYNLCNEPWMRYGVGVVADRGLKHSQWTSARLMKEVLYLETKTMRYELSRDEEGSSAVWGDAPF